MSSVVRHSIKKVKRYWREHGPLTTARAIGETLLSPLFRHRKRFVLDISLAESREASVWGPAETLLIFGPDNLGEISTELLNSLEPEKHPEEFHNICHGNRLFVILCQGQCIYRSYIRIASCTGHDRKAVFFDGLEDIPEIRQALIIKNARGVDLHKHVRKGLHTRVVNEQLRLLQSLGHDRAILYIMAGNVLSIKGNTAAGFKPLRTLNDWILLNRVVFQHIAENGHARWRVFLQ